MTHWNCNSIKNKKIELKNFLNNYNPLIVSLNETKSDNIGDLVFKNYNVIRKDKNSRSGGVAILIKEGIRFEQSNIYDKFNLQLLTLKIFINPTNQFHFISWYHPPNEKLPDAKFFKELGKLKRFILTGDLNAKHKAWFASRENELGKSLEKILSKSKNISIVKNKTPTHFSTHRTYDILDLILTSSQLLKKITEIKVLKHELSSDHFPINFRLKLNEKFEYEKNTKITKIDYKNLHKDMESNFKIFSDQGLETKNFPIETLIDTVQKNYQLSLEKNTKFALKKIDNLNLPNNIIKLINEKKKLGNKLLLLTALYLSLGTTSSVKLLKKKS